MFYLKIAIFYGIACVFQGAQSAQSVQSAQNVSSNRTAEILWNLSHLALQGRQNFRPQLYSGKYPPYYYNHPHKEQYGLSQYAESNNNYNPRPDYLQNDYLQNVYPERPRPPTYPQRPYDGQFYPQKPFYPQQVYNPQRPDYPPAPFANIRPSFMDALQSIARNDDLHCVPKLLCEATSGTISARQLPGFQLPQLPFNLDANSLIGLLSAFGGVTNSPLLLFGQAALLGYSSKGNNHMCSNNYPQCPSDPDKLVAYLNNHNGGFFRFFNGLQPQYNPSLNYAPNYSSQTYAPNYRPQRYPSNYNYPPHGYYQKSNAEQRIQNKQVEYIPTNKYPIDNSNGVKFPSEQSDFFSGRLLKSQKALKFPTDELYSNYAEQPFRKPKELPFNIYYYQNNNNNNELDFQRPLPNHIANPMIFPDRTGTGELILDPEDLKDYSQPFRNQNNNIISFIPDLANDALYYTNGNSNGNSFGLNTPSTNFNRNAKSLFSFPKQ